MKHLKLFFALFAMLALGVGKAWGAEASFTIKFKDNGSDASTALTATTFTKQVAEGADLIKSVSTSYCYPGTGGLKCSSNNNNGTFTLTLNNSYTISKIVLNVKNKNATTKTVKVGNTSFSTSDSWSTTSFKDLAFTGAETTSDKITVSLAGTTNKKRVAYIASMTVYYKTDESSSEETVVSVPTFSVPECTFYSSSLDVELSCATDGATIHYTIDGTTPSETSPTYSGAIAINKSTTIKAIAVKDGLTDSEVATATYTKGETVTSYDIDFETNALEAYVNWDFSNITIAKTITAQRGTYYGNTSGKASASIKTKEKIQYPGILTFYVSKESTNTTASNWLVQVSENGTTWSTVGTISATEMTKGDWKGHSVDLSDYENVYVKISYGSSTAVRAIDEISLAQGVAPVKYTLTIENPENGTLSVTKGGASVASGDQFKAGTSLVVTPTPASGYLFESLTVGGTQVELSEGKYTFTMPENNVTISATFKANEKPAATLTLSKNGETELLPGDYKQDDVVTLPDFESDCSKTFVGWSENPNCNTEPEYKAGDSYQLKLEGNQTLYAVYADGEGGGSFTITKTMSEIVSTNGYTVSSGNTVTCYTSLTLDENITLSTTGLPNCGSFWSDPCEWRLYQNKSGNAIVTATNGCSLTSVKFTFSYSNTGTLLNNGAAMKSGTAVSASGTSATYTVGNSGSVTNGQIRITAIEVSYSKEGEYSNYSTTCAAAPKAEVNPTSVTATAAGGSGKVEVTYENVNTANVAVALYNDATCTEAFTAGWLTADLDVDKNITYTVSATTLYTERKAYIQLTAPETTGAVDPAVVVIPVTQAAKDKVFASLEALLAAITPTTEGVEVTVTLNNEVIQDFYTSGSYRNGIALNVPYQGGVKVIEIYCKDVPAEWVKGGKVSGTITCPWKLYNSTWELCPTAWTELTYTAPATVKSIAVSGTPTKTTYVDGEAFDPTGLVVTATLTDDSTEPIDVALVDWTFDPETLSKGETSVSVVATYNTMASAAYEVTGLTVNDIPTKTVAEFIAAGGTRCYLEGIVSNITNTTYGNFDLTDASGTIYVYGCLNEAGEKQKFAELGVKKGDKIKVIADEYELYGGTKDEAKNVQYVSHISAASITVENITMEVDEVATITATVDRADAVVTYTIKENAENAISLSGNTITALAEGTATITATVAEGATYLGNSVDFTVTVGPKTESDEVVILAELDGKWYAMKGAVPTGKSNQLDALEVTYFNGILYNVAESDKASITWTRSVVDGKATFANNGKYLKGDTDTDLTLSASVDDKCKWMWDDENGYYTTNTSGTIRTFLYRNGYNFKNYGVSQAGKEDANGNYSELPVVTAPVYTTGDVTYTRATTAGKFGTICLPFGSTNYTGAEFFEFVGSETGKVYIGSVDELVAGVPYIFLASAAKVVVTSDGTTAATPGNSNGLYGTFTDNTEVAVGNYILKDNALCQAEAICWVNAYRAYIVMNEVPTGVPTQMPGRRYIGMNVQGENETTGVEDLFTTDAPVKVIENGQLIIIRDGVKYNVQGQVIK